MVLSGPTARVILVVVCIIFNTRTTNVGGFLSALGFQHPEEPQHARPAESRGTSGSASKKAAVMSKVEVHGTRGKCLDGSPPVYYISRGRQTHKWVVFLQGGDWCTRHLPTGVKDSRRSCPMRSEADGSSWRMKPLKSLKAVGQVYGPLSASRDRNPMMHDWNKVYLQNCDASSFASSVAAGPIEIQGRRLYFRGLQIMEGVIEHLLEHQGLGEATDLVLAGCSAGGLAVYLHVDRWREALAAKAAALGRSASSVNVVGLADSGFFLRGGKPGPSAAGAATDCDYEARMRFLFSELNAAAAVPAACAAAAAPGESYKCMFAEHLLPHVRTPVFTLQSVSDGWQLEWIACNATAGTLDAKLHRSSVLAAIERALGVVDASPSGAGPIHGAFIDGCQHHCHCYNDIVIGNTTQVQAFQRFYIAVTTAEGRRGNGAPYSLGDSAAGAFVWKDLKCGILLSTDGTTECPYKPFSWEF